MNDNVEGVANSDQPSDRSSARSSSSSQPATPLGKSEQAPSVEINSSGEEGSATGQQPLVEEEDNPLDDDDGIPSPPQPSALLNTSSASIVRRGSVAANNAQRAQRPVDPSTMFKTKIVILGSLKCGKTSIANYLADATESVRIVEFESNDLELNGRNIDAEVELWDCSGDRKYEQCWPAIQRGAHGVILVYDCEDESSVKDMQRWHSAFVLQRAIKPNRVLIFAHKVPKEDREGPSEVFNTPSSLAHLHTVRTNLGGESGDALRLEFNNFLCMVISALATNDPMN